MGAEEVSEGVEGRPGRGREGEGGGTEEVRALCPVLTTTTTPIPRVENHFTETTPSTSVRGRLGFATVLAVELNFSRFEVGGPGSYQN